MTEFNEYFEGRFSLSEQQKAVVNSKGNVIVSASAGTGKTHTIIAKLIKGIYERKYGVNQILAITYTNAGVNELKTRLRKELTELEKNMHGEDKVYLREQLTLVETADVLTIHSLCDNILKNFGYLNEDISPKQIKNVYSTLPQNIEKLAMKYTLETAVKNPKSSKLIFENLIEKPNNLNPLMEAIKETAKITRYETIDDLLDRNNTNYNYYKSFLEIKDEKVKDAVVKNIRKKCNEIIVVIDSLNQKIINNLSLKSCLDLGDDMKRQSLEQLNDMKVFLESDEILDRDGIYELSKIAENLNLTKLKIKEDYKHDPIITAALETFQELFIYTSNNLYNIYIAQTEKELEIEKNLNEEIIKLSRVYQGYVDLLKKEYNAIDYDDQIYYAYQILEENEEVRNFYQNKYHEILFDEFQDTNNIQYAIIEMIAKDGDTNLVRVGDAKQSIYRFQGAEPLLMQNLMKKQGVEVLSLNQNFRSKSSIIESVNNIFEHRMNIFKENVFTEIDISTYGTWKYQNDFIQTLNCSKVNFEFFESEEDIHISTAKLVSSSIYKNYVEKKDLLDIYAKKDGKVTLINRDIDFKDITVLIPTWSYADVLKEEFDKIGIPHDITPRKNFYQSDLIKEVTDWFYYATSREEKYLLNILRNYYLLSYSEILDIKGSYGSILEGLKKSNINQYESIYSEIENTVRSLLSKDSVDALLEIANIQNKYDNYSAEDKANFDLLLARAIETNNQYITIYDFVEYLGSIQSVRFMNETDDFANASLSGDDDNVVRVMTYHASKGLEFPVVYMLPADRITYRGNSRANYDEKFGLMLSHSDKFLNRYRGMYWNIYIEQQKLENIEEQIRLLYVGMTRATHKLHVTEVTKTLKSSSKKNDFKLVDSDYYRAISKIQDGNKMRSSGLNIFSDILYSSLYPTKPITKQNLESYLINENISIEKQTQDIKEVQTKKIKNIPDSIDFFKLLDSGQEDQFGFNKNFVEASRYGSILHNALEQLPFNIIWDDEELELCFVEHNIEIPKNIRSKVKDELRKFQNNPFTNQILSHSPLIKKELPIIYYNEFGHPVQNVIDLSIITEDKYIIIDYKTDVNVDCNTLLLRYYDQVNTYKNIVEMEYKNKKEVSAYIYSFYLNKYIEVTNK